MAVDFQTLTIDPTTLVNAAPSSAVRVKVRTNTGGAIIDAAANKIFLGTHAVDTKTSVAISLPVTDGASNPTDFQYAVDLEYVDAATRQRTTWPSGWFSFTEAANLADVVAEQYAPPTWQTTFMDRAQELLDQQEAISGLTGEDEAVALLLGSDSDTRDAADVRIEEVGGQHFTPPRYQDPSGWSVAPSDTYHVMDFVPANHRADDYENSSFDHTPYIQAAEDYCSGHGGGTVIASPWKYRVEQIEHKNGVHLKGGAFTFGGITPPGVGTEFIQKEGTNKTLIVFDTNEGLGAARDCASGGLSYLMLYGRAGATAGSGVSTRDIAGNPLRWQHANFMHHIIARRMAEHGVEFTGGSALMHVENVGAYKNGGYGMLCDGSFNADDLQFIQLLNVWGDGNHAGATLAIKGLASHYAANLIGIKGEQIENDVLYPGVASNENAVHLIDCAGFINFIGGQHISSGDGLTATLKPGDFAKVLGSAGVRPTISARGVKIRVRTDQVTGATPMLIHDTANGGDYSIPADIVDAIYGTDIRTRKQGVGTVHDVLGLIGESVRPVNLTHSRTIRGTAPGLVLESTSAAANERVWQVSAQNTGKFLIRGYDDAGNFGFNLLSGDRTGAGTPAIGFLGATEVTRRTLGAAATDAATTQTLANALRQALIDLGLGQA